MRGTRTAVAVLAATTVIGGSVFVRAGQQPGRGTQEPVGQGQTPSRFPLAPTIRERGTSVTPALEGWFHGRDGNDYFLVGYFNRNLKQEFDLPPGPTNHVDPGGPDLGQPTHFLLGRQWGVFTIKVPKDLGTKKLSWTIVANGLTNTITLHTQADYIVEPYKANWNDNTPPVLKLEPNGKAFTGPPIGIAAAYTTTVSNPLTLTSWITDEGPVGRGAPGGGRGRGVPARGATRGTAPDANGAAPDAAAAPHAGAGPSAGGPPAQGTNDSGAGGGRAGRGGADGPDAAAGGFPGFQSPPRVSVTWTKFRGPGNVAFANPKPTIEEASGKSETTATFDAPGEYILRLQGNDSSGDGGGGEQCCWTNLHVKVTVRPAL